MTEHRQKRALLGLHSNAWRQIRQLLERHGIQPPLSTRALYGWRAQLHSLAWRAERRPRAGEDLPIGLLACGFWRSGTTLLHECLSRDPRWRAPTTHECMNPGQPRPSTHQVMKRPMDNLPIGANSPQEDEFALLNLGAPSFYRLLLCPCAWRELLDELASGDAHATWPKRENLLREFCAWLHLRDPRALLLKSPSHSFALARLLALAPHARAVIILRDWRAVWQSCLKMWSTMCGLYSLGPWTPEGLARMTHATMLEYARVLPKQLQVIEASRIAVIEYEELIAAPVATIGRVYERFSLSMPDNLAGTIDDFVARTRPSKTAFQRNNYLMTPGAEAELADAQSALSAATSAFRVAVTR